MDAKDVIFQYVKTHGLLMRNGELLTTAPPAPAEPAPAPLRRIKGGGKGMRTPWKNPLRFQVIRGGKTGGSP